MKKFLAAAVLSLFAISCGEDVSNLKTSEDTKKVTLKFADLENSDGNICVSIFTEDGNFPDIDGTPVYEGCFETNEIKETGVSIDLPSGTYASAIFHDENGNELMDMKNILGIKVPKEPFGFSNNPKMKMRAPKFEECAFEVTSDTELTIKLKTL